MNKLVIKIFLFFIYSLAVYILLIFVQVSILGENYKFSNLITYNKKPPYLKYKIEELKNKNFQNIDILFLGSSHAEGGLDVRIFEKNGLKTYNLGSSAQTPLQTEILLTRYLNLINPKLIIYSVFPNDFASDGIESSLDFIKSDFNNMSTFNLFIKLKNIKLFNLFIYEYLNNKFNIFNLKNQNFINDSYVNSGFVDYGNNKFKLQDSTLNNKDNLVINYLEYFQKNITLIKSLNIPVLLIRLPETKYYNALNTKNFDSTMSFYGQYYNLNSLIQLNDSLHFFDDNHLNSDGVKVVNEYIIKNIINNHAF